MIGAVVILALLVLLLLAVVVVLFSRDNQEKKIIARMELEKKQYQIIIDQHLNTIKKLEAMRDERKINVSPVGTVADAAAAFDALNGRR